jgi:hypothetical protein
MNRLDYLRAKRRILEVFVPGCDSASVAKSLGDEEMETLLDAVTPSLPFRKPAQMQSLSMFLFEGAKRFDRWFPPSPYVVPKGHHERFAKFVSAFWRVEHDAPTNCAVFKLHLIRDHVFKRFDEMPLCAIALPEVVQFQQQIEQIPVPSSLVKQAEFTQQKSELLFVLNGLTDRSLRTIFHMCCISSHLSLISGGWVSPCEHPLSLPFERWRKALFEQVKTQPYQLGPLDGRQARQLLSLSRKHLLTVALIPSVSNRCQERSRQLMAGLSRLQWLFRSSTT